MDQRTRRGRCGQARALRTGSAEQAWSQAGDTATRTGHGPHCPSRPSSRRSGNFSERPSPRYEVLGSPWNVGEEIKSVAKGVRLDKPQAPGVSGRPPRGFSVAAVTVSWRRRAAPRLAQEGSDAGIPATWADPRLADVLSRHGDSCQTHSGKATWSLLDLPSVSTDVHAGPQGTEAI